MPADPQHHVARIGPALCQLPLPQLMGEIGRRLPGERGVGLTQTLSGITVTGGACLQTACGIALLPQYRRLAGHGIPVGPVRHGGIIGRNGELIGWPEPVGDPSHLRVLPPPVGIGAHLPIEVADIEPRQPRCARAVAAAVEPVTGEAGIGCACSGTAQGDQLTGRRKPAFGRSVDVRASRHRSHQHGARGSSAEPHKVHRGETNCRSHRFRGSFVWSGGRLLKAAAVALLLILPACKPPPDERHHMPEASAERGRAIIARAGCASCHTVPGIRWPQGQLGPSLHGFAASNLISGRLPNRPDILAAYVANAPAVLPGTTMPAMPISKGESRDVAAYLYTLEP